MLEYYVQFPRSFDLPLNAPLYLKFQLYYEINYYSEQRPNLLRLPFWTLNTANF